MAPGVSSQFAIAFTGQSAGRREQGANWPIGHTYFDLADPVEIDPAVDSFSSLV
ncbi:MAG: hypothetical protein M9908_00600 [Phyllobacteriaceae bacterium]|nr:hypothetical protein [Phyllobacteriaceae bacterium]